MSRTQPRPEELSPATDPGEGSQGTANAGPSYIYDDEADHQVHSEAIARIFDGERRLATNLMGTWQGLRIDHALPRFQDFMENFPENQKINQVWHNCFILRIDQHGEGGEFKMIGEGIAERSGIGSACDTIKDVPRASFLGQVLAARQEVVEKAFPMLNRGQFRGVDGKPYMYRSILLPFSGSDGDLDHLVGGANAKTLAVDQAS